MVRFIVVMIIVSINALSIKESYGKEYDFSYINPYKDEAMSYLKEGEISNVEKSINNYYFDCKELSDAEKDKYEKCKEEQSKIKEDSEHNKEQNYKAYELKKKGEEFVDQQGTTGEGMSESEKDAADAFSYVHHNAGTNLLENSYIEINKDLNVISNEVTKNPMVRLNAKVKTVEGEEIEGTDCAVSDRNAEKDEITLEEYEKEEEETEIEDSEGSCEKDVVGPFYCEESLEEVGCQQKSDCGYNAGGVLMGSVQSGIEFRYNYPTIVFGNTYGKSSGYMSDREQRQSTVFRCGRECCAIGSVNATFVIKDLKDVDEFRIKRLNYVQPIMIKLNGHVIYHSFGGYKFQKTGGYASGEQLRSFATKNGHWDAPREWRSLIDTGNGVYSCYPNNAGYLTFTPGSFGHTAAGGEYFRSFDHSDLKDKLREGSNNIELTIAYDDNAFVETEFYLRQHCCKKWGDGEWKGNCPK